MGFGSCRISSIWSWGLIIVFYTLFNGAVDPANVKRAIEVLTGFSLGAESIALFARVGGGIYTKRPT